MNESKKEDIFDRLMHLPVLRVFEPFYKRYKEALLYLFFGGITFFLNIILFALIGRFTNINELVNNVICWIICVLFQFFTNRTWVFDAKVEGAGSFFKQMAGFFGGRLFTLVVEEVILAVFISWLGLNAMVVKILAQVVVIVLNYVISKFIVFKKKT
ncbi:MAG: GtrA family protein [Eubacterium sp.]|nr:GtrA family protein [Eubacterium sp.]